MTRSEMAMLERYRLVVVFMSLKRWIMRMVMVLPVMPMMKSRMQMVVTGMRVEVGKRESPQWWSSINSSILMQVCRCRLIRSKCTRGWGWTKLTQLLHWMSICNIRPTLSKKVERLNKRWKRRDLWRLYLVLCCRWWPFFYCVRAEHHLVWFLIKYWDHRRWRHIGMRWEAGLWLSMCEFKC